MKTKIVIATSNLHKKQEFEELFIHEKIEFLTLVDLKLNFKIIEDGQTFEDNAKIKALETAKYCDEIIIADDSGLIIDALPDILNVHSARFMEGEPYKKKCEEILKRMENITNRRARFVCCICLALKNKKYFTFKGICEGQIAYKIMGDNGFGYDPIFIPDGFNKTFSELTEYEKNQISHRGIATLKLKEFLKGRVKNEDIVNE